MVVVVVVVLSVLVEVVVAAAVLFLVLVLMLRIPRLASVGVATGCTIVRPFGSLQNAGGCTGAERGHCEVGIGEVS